MKEYTPVRPRSGGLIHATSLTDAHRTMCNRICSGWVVAFGHLECPRCRDLLPHNKTMRGQQ